MKIIVAGTRPTRAANPEWFTGQVWQELIIEAPEPARVIALSVGFAPGARTNWHTHPLGQTLQVVSGVGRVQIEGEPVRAIRAGDTVWIAPGEKHWHGATPEHAMVHIAIHEVLDGSSAEWLEPVSDEDFMKAPD